MCFRIVFTIICVIRSILGCGLVPHTLLYRDGDYLDFELINLSRSKNIRFFEFNGLVCNTTEVIPLIISHMVADNRFWKMFAIYDRIVRGENICAYSIVKVEGVDEREPLKLFELVYDVDRVVSTDNATSKVFHFKIVLDWVRSCFDINERADIEETVSKLDSDPNVDVINTEYTMTEVYTCKPERANEPAIVQFYNKRSATISSLMDRTGEPKYIQIEFDKFDNNTYISCANRPSASEVQIQKWTKIIVRPYQTSEYSIEKIHKYVETDTYDFECTQRPSATLFLVHLNDNNEIIAAASSNEGTWNLEKQFRLSKSDNNTRVLCLRFECDHNYTENFDECQRRETNQIRFLMREDSVGVRKCQLPAYPPNGRYQVVNHPSSIPFQKVEFWILDVTCDLGFGIKDGGNRLYCNAGVWSPSNKLPNCIPFCKLNPHPGVRYNCQAQNTTGSTTRPCHAYEPPGMLAIPECREPDFTSNEELPIMRCSPEGKWSHNPKCTPACGEVTPYGVGLISKGSYAKLGELPWHVAIYQKTTTPYRQICGGSIVRASVVISAAHCFWDDHRPEDQKLRPASEYAVAAGKLYRPWNDPEDNKRAQKSNVTLIKIPSHFHGHSSSFTDDLAVLVLSKSFEYKLHIAPVCLNFDDQLDREQVADGMIGKVAGWGATSQVEDASPELKVVDLPIVPYDKCYSLSPISFRRYITVDKICAGYKDKGTSVCTGDSGGGLVVAGTDRGVTRFYLRGVVSTAPDEQFSCTANEITAFTHVIKHYDLIKSYLLL